MIDLYTIGHSNHPLPRFVELLQRHVIDLVADVRSVPHSRRHPQFNKEALAASLQAAGIGYEFLGRELGARAEDPMLYENGRVSWAKLAATGLFQFGLDRLCALAASKRTAIMCAEKEPLDCHRTLLVAQALVRSMGTDPLSGSVPGLGQSGSDPNGGSDPIRVVEVMHIHADGALESHRDCLLRLVAASKLPADDLFRSEDDRIAEACRFREEKIAFRR